MQRRTSSYTTDTQEQKENWTAGELIEQVPNARPRRKTLEWWYRFSAPPELPADTPLAEREVVRRGRLTSIVLLAIMVVLVIPLLNAFVTINFTLIPHLSIALVIVLIAARLNRQGRITLAGILVLIVVGVGNAAGLLFSTYYFHGALDTSSLPLLDLEVQAELVAVSLLPPSSVFIVAALNTCLFWAVVTFMPHTPVLAATLKMRGYGVLITPIILQIVVAVVTYIWVFSTTQAIRRADRAEVIASLEHTLAQQNQKTAEEKVMLEEGVQQLVQAHTRAANGDLNVRATLPMDHGLWPLAGAFNTLLARFRRAQSSQMELQQMQQAAGIFFEALTHAKGGPMHWQRTGTFFDQLAQQYNMNHRDPRLPANPFNRNY